MNDRLIIAARVKKTIEFIDKTVENYPHRYSALKDTISKTSYDLLENVYCANFSDSDHRRQYYQMMLVKLQLLNYYVKVSFDHKLVSLKRYQTIGDHLLDIHKMIIGWAKYHEKTKEPIPATR